MKKFSCLIFIIFIIFEKISFAAEIPRANLDEAERYFNNAYVHFMKREYREAQIYLDRAIQENTYMVDYYLLSALNLNRMGDSEGAMSAIKSYLEVRPMDKSAGRIQDYFEEQNSILRTVLDTAPVPVSWRYSQTTVQTEWNTGYTRPFSIKGLGKVSSLGEVVSIPDTFGDKIYIRSPLSAPAVKEIEIPSPVTAIPLGDGTFRVFSSNGDLYLLKNIDVAENSKLISSDYSEYIASLPSMVVSDADMISENLFAVSDPADRNIAFYSFTPQGINMRTWKPEPETGDLLFEPVALEAYADWLAVADRANDRVYILNTVSRESFYIPKISKPRDLTWSTFGDLFVLTEDGDVFDFTIDFGTRSFADKHSGSLYSGMQNIWTFFHSPYGGINWMDIGASRIYKAVMIPGREDLPGFLSIYDPAIALNSQNNESFILQATLITPFVNYSLNNRVIAQSVWNERNMRAHVSWQRAANFDALFFHAPFPRNYSFPLNVRHAQVSLGSDIFPALYSLWLLHSPSLTNIIIDDSIPLNAGDLTRLLKFCLLNGLELDIFARDIPSVSLKRASSFSGGHTLFSLNNSISLPTRPSHLQLFIPLPVDLSSSGYPGRSILSLFLDTGLIQSREWLPLFPDFFNFESE